MDWGEAQGDSTKAGLANLPSGEVMQFAHCSLSAPLSCPSEAKPCCWAHTVVCGLEQQCHWLRRSVQSPAADAHISAAIQSPRSLCTECLYPNYSCLQGDRWSNETQWDAKQLMKMLLVVLNRSPSPPAMHYISCGGKPWRVATKLSDIFGHYDSFQWLGQK